MFRNAHTCRKSKLEAQGKRLNFTPGRPPTITAKQRQLLQQETAARTGTPEAFDQATIKQRILELRNQNRDEFGFKLNPESQSKWTTNRVIKELGARAIMPDPQDQRRANALCGTWQFVYMAAFVLGTMRDARGRTILPRNMVNFDATQFILTNASVMVTKSVVDEQEYKNLRQTKAAQKYIENAGRKRFLRIKGMFVIYASSEAGDTVFWLRCLPSGTEFYAETHHHVVLQILY